MVEAHAFKVKDQVVVVGKTLTFLGRKFKGRRGKVTGHLVKHGLTLTRVKFSDGEALYEEEDLEVYNV